MNAVNQLIADHELVERMFKESEAAKPSGKQDIFFRIKAALEAHAWIEESIFYPTLQSSGDEELVKITSEAIQEHITMKCLLGEIAAVSADASKFEPLLTKLIEDVRHHVKEEEGTMFPAVKETVTTDVLDALGSQMEAERERFESSTETIYG